MYKIALLLALGASIVLGEDPQAVVAFEAELETKSVRRLPDGNVIEQSYRSKHARDALGRTRVETPNTIVVTDPKTRTVVFMDRRSHIARRSHVAPPPEFPVVPRRSAAEAGENLGKATMAGFETEGSRVVAIISANAVGNREPIHQTQEIWMSTELHFALLRKSSDPMNGETTQRVITLRKTNDFPADYFAVPGGYTIIEVEGQPQPSPLQ